MGVLFLLSVADTLIGTHLDDKYTIRALPGSRQAISGNLDRPVRLSEEVLIHVDSPGLKVAVDQVRGRFWRGELIVSSTVADGVYHLKAICGPSADLSVVPEYRIVVFPSAAELNASLPSLIRRLAGIPPWWIGAAAGPILAACLLISFRQADHRYRALDQQGLAPIVKLARHKDHWEIAAALPRPHGFRSGVCLEVVDRHLRCVGWTTITHIDAGLVFGHMALTAPVRPNGYLRLASPDPPR